MLRFGSESDYEALRRIYHGLYINLPIHLYNELTCMCYIYSKLMSKQGWQKLYWT